MIIRMLVLFLALLIPFPAMAQGGEVNLFIWSEYIPDEVVEQFTAETGINVRISTYDSNEAMYAKVKLTGQGYDLIVPSSDYVGLMRREGLLLELDKEKLPNLKNLDPSFRNLPFDPESAYSVPYMWGSTAIAVNTGMVDAPAVESLASLESLWNPEWEGKLLLPNDMREVIGLALISLGMPINETDPGKLEQAVEKASGLMKQARVFDSDSPKHALLSGEVAVAVLWSGEAYIANSENPAIRYVYPKEGFSLWLDSLCIPKGAANVDEAHAFLDYLLRPDVAAAISEEMGYSTPNAAAVDMMSQELRDNPIVYPDAETLARGQYLDDIGEAIRLYEDAWVKLKSGE